jgi:phosphohistidine phosphatase SixA
MNRLLILLIFVGLTIPVLSQDSFTIYLVRHAEKEVSETNPSDPELTACGQERAKSLAHFLSDVEIEAIHSTHYIRTISTANPTAKTADLKIQSYNPNDLDYFAQILLDRAENALVVGHSNTTDELAALLHGPDYVSMPISDSEYDRIYQVVVCGDLVEVNLFHSAFSCGE